LFNIAVQRYGK